jgi:selenide,water dikinase
VIPGGTKRNAEWLGERVRWDENLPEPLRWALYDAQTSGGLLISVAPDHADDLVRRLGEKNTLSAALIGEITGGPEGAIRVDA